MRLSVGLALLFFHFSLIVVAQVPDTDWVFTDDIATINDRVVASIETRDGGYLFLGEYTNVNCGLGCGYDEYHRVAYKLSRTGTVEWKTTLVGSEGEPAQTGQIIELNNNGGYILVSNLGAVQKLGLNGQLGTQVREGFVLDHIAYVDNKIVAMWNFEPKIYTYDANLTQLSVYDASTLPLTSFTASLNPGKLIVVSNTAGTGKVTEFNLAFVEQWSETFGGTELGNATPYPSKNKNGAGSGHIEITKSTTFTRTYNIRDYLLTGSKAGQTWIYADGNEKSFASTISGRAITNDGRIVLSRTDSLVMLNGDLTTAWRTDQLKGTPIGVSNDGSFYYFGGQNLRMVKTKAAIFRNTNLFYYSNIDYAFCGSPNPECDTYLTTYVDFITGQFMDYNNDGFLDYYQQVNKTSNYVPGDPPGSIINATLNVLVKQSGSLFDVFNKKQYETGVFEAFNFKMTDFDSDGQLEFFNNTLNNINTTTGELTSQTSGLPVLTNPGNIASSFADFDNNGLIDVFRNNDAIYLQTVANSYTKLPSSTLISIENPILLDINNDGTIDVVDVAGRSIYLNQNLVFTKHATTLTHTPVFPIELNGDGHMDFIGRTGDVFYSCINSGSLTFTYTALSLPAPVFAVGDLNNDGKSDLAAGNSLYFNNGTGVFAKPQNGEYYLPILMPHFEAIKGITSGNFDDDGDLDLAVTDSHQLVFVQNNQTVANQKPSAPTNLRATRSGSGATFEWNASTDDTTPAASLTYNFYLKKGSQLIDNAHSLATGKRTLVNTGNAGFRLAFQKPNLPVGTYQWSVQAIDKGLEPSSFPTEQTFFITNNPTDILLSNATTPENTITAIGTFTTTDVDGDETFQYTLVAGTGSTDNALFTLTGSSLAAASITALNFESKSTYSIRVKTTDSRQGTFEKVIIITVTNVQETATDISLSATSISENLPIGTDIGTFTDNDPDVADVSLYTLVAGTGDTDNASFSIAGDKLKSGQLFNYEIKNTYSIRVQIDDQQGQTFQKALAITITDVNDLAKPVINTPIQITQSEFVLTWTAIEGATTYELEVSADDFSSLLTGYNPKVVNTTTTTVANLTAGTSYKARLRAVNGTDKSPVSDSKSQITVPPNPVAIDPVQVDGSSFKAGWTASTGATSYELEVSTGIDFVPLPDYNPKVITGAVDFVVTGLTAETVYNYRVRAVNSAGKSDNSNEKSVLTSAQGAVALKINTDATVSTIPLGFGTTKIRVTISGGTGTRTVKLRHKPIIVPGNSFSSITAVLKSGDEYEADVSETFFDELGLEFYFEAMDQIATVKQSKSSYLYISIPASANKSIPFATGFNGQQDTYQMFSVPYNLSDANISNVFDPPLGGQNKTQWRLYHYQNGANAEYPDVVKKIELGKGYWFNTIKEGLQVKIGQASVEQVTQSESFSMTLAKNWNQIGNPYPFSVDWSAAIGGNDKVGELNFYNNGAYTVNNTFRPWTGAFVFADEATEVLIPISARTNGRVAQTEELTSTIDQEAWKIPLQLSVGVLSVQGGIGMHPQANTSKDKYDRITLPRFINYIELHTNHSEFFAPHFATDVVPSEESYTWLFDVDSNLEGGKGELTWDNQSFGSAESSLILIDLHDQTWVDMKSTGKYSFTQGEGRQFSIAYNRKGEILPGITMLGNAYPNPFVSEVTIPVLVDKGQSIIRIDVYNLLGQRIRTLSKEFKEAGMQVIMWDGLDEQGSDVSNGIFLYRMSDRTSEVKRMIKQ